MITYQDFLEVGQEERDRMEFCLRVISSHKRSELYQTALLADEYYRKKNRTIVNFQKLLYTISGVAVPDNFSANYKIRKAFFPYFVTQQTQYLLGNGVTWNEQATSDRLGTKNKEFDTQLQDAAKKALVGGVSFGLFNMDHIDVFSVLEFAPLFDEENGALRAGVRFWQLDYGKPLRATLYEEDGYTDYIWKNGEGEIRNPKRKYKQIVLTTIAGGDEIFDGENYGSFPVVPLWANTKHQSEFIGLQEGIDCYDLIKSGFANTVDEASMIYWTINNAGGMDDVDLASFVNHMRTVKAAVVEDSGARAESHAIEAPYQSRETLLNLLREDLYEDYMALDIRKLAGAATATEIRAAYEPMNIKADDFEYCVIEFINGILSLAGLPDEEPSFTRSMIVNIQEEIQTLTQAGEYLDSEYVTRRILQLLGDGDQADEVLNRMAQEDMERYGYGSGTQGDGQETGSSGEENPEGI